MSNQLRVMTCAGICAAVKNEERERVARRQWGAWYLDTDTLELVYRDAAGHNRHFLNLERCGSSAAVLDWICQLAGKDWTSPRDIGDLVAAFRDILDPQASMCAFSASGAPGKTIDATAFLRACYSNAGGSP
jgi:hypothetical protein